MEIIIIIALLVIFAVYLSKFVISLASILALKKTNDKAVNFLSWCNLILLLTIIFLMALNILT